MIGPEDSFPVGEDVRRELDGFLDVPGSAGAWTRAGILAAGPGGVLYVATGYAVAAVNSATAGSIIGE